MRKLLIAFLIPCLFLLPILTHAVYEVTIYPTDDAYVVVDLTDPTDRLGLRTLNTGDFNFTKVWYAWNITGKGELVISYALFKFDLHNISARDVISAKLELTVYNVRLTGASREVVLFKGINNTWSESTVNFNNHPGFDPNDTVSIVILPIAKTYSWNVTKWVKENAGGQLTIYVSFKRLFRNNEEQVVFVSRNYPDPKYKPKLVVELIGEAPPKKGEAQPFVDPFILAAVVGAVAVAFVAFVFLRRRRKVEEKKEKRPVRRPRRRAKKA